ncbi:Relaxase/Mobilisation nuclease domain-containing protein [Mucilaginibacter pineti]|uniref:Relaxase/Mobilisation nuclease domain-containing protein n=1 Tax=Mucilaginibacter pineti TaxID=1391627 RepID=A0A1G7IKH4_9SPHI|nr:relaxase/mobilization nuclease domain-containing protein [Mucilaginibacter pineti]SDF13250.1 Relaxase/Mobilisation nuclease domain-containing protein [Mucilaginibacter pineti]
MVAVIHSSSSLRNILNYNEQKVKAGVAICIDAAFYPKDPADLTFQQKLLRLEKLTELNQQTTVNSVHISLNFDPAEKLSADQLREIAGVYMDKLGFDGQPYLLYEHLDSGHPHVHLVTTNIRADGKRIALHNLGKDFSDPARKFTELRFGLVRAEDSKLLRAYKLKPVNAQKVQYGKAETKRAISNVLQSVIPQYKYASLPELNAVLRLYNIAADRGDENSRVFQHQGLLYRLLDEQGKRVGVPIKASLFFSKPTLKVLEERFVQNSGRKEPHKARIKNTIDLCLLYGQRSLPAFTGALKKEGIDTIIRENSEGIIYGITYVDHRTQCVFNGSALGKPYSAKVIQERCGLTPAYTGKSEKTKLEPDIRRAGDETTGNAFQHIRDFAEALLLPDSQPERMDWELKRKRKKRKRQKIQPD